MQRCSKEFREEAVSLSDEIGVKKAAQQLGMSYQTLAGWRKTRKRKEDESKEEIPAKTVEELRKENAELRKANDILKDALGFFALDRKK